MKKLSLSVTGMHCISCETLLKEILTDEGAMKVDVSYKTGKATVEYDEGKLTEQKIKQLIENEGYKVKQ